MEVALAVIAATAVFRSEARVDGAARSIDEFEKLFDVGRALLTIGEEHCGQLCAGKAGCWGTHGGLTPLNVGVRQRGDA